MPTREAAVINWAEPPEDAFQIGGTRQVLAGRSQIFVDGLKEKPGAWACYGLKARGSAEHLRRTYGLEVRIQHWSGDQYKVYARWNGAK